MMVMFMVMSMSLTFGNGLLNLDDSFITDDIKFCLGIDLTICQLSADSTVL